MVVIVSWVTLATPRHQCWPGASLPTLEQHCSLVGVRKVSIIALDIVFRHLS